MKQLVLVFIVIIFLFSCQHKGQHQEKTSIRKVDTLTLGEFKQKKIVRYSIRNAKICIATEDYLNGIEVFHQRYKKWLSEAEKSHSSYDTYTKYFRFLDSVYQTVQLEMKTKDTIDISQKLFSKYGLGSLVQFENFIENNKCAIYDENGIRQYRIIRKHESYYGGSLDAWVGRRYYLLSNKTYFYEIIDLIS